MSELQLKEVREVVRKARASSAPGPSGTSYKVYKYCPKLLLRLWYILRVFWRRGRIPDQWRVAEGVWIPKEENSTQLDQFRIISLLCVEAKVFFSAVSNRLCTYLAENTYIDTSVQKGGISGMPGCLEHTGVVTQLIREARENKGNLSVLWLDLENAFGSIPHKLVQFTLTKHHVPSRCRDLIADYYSNFRMRVSSGAITSSWHKVEIGIITGCTISVTLFSLAMNMLTKSAEPECRGPRTNSGQRQPPIRAFMDDLTVMTESVPGCRWILKGLEELVEWARMRFKPAKSRSMVLRKGKVVDKFRFNIADTAIPSISEKPVKSLGKVFDCSLRDTTSIQSTCTELDGWLKSVDKSGLPGKFKAWVYQHGILPRILWPLLVYAVPISTVETLERRLFSGRWVLQEAYSSDYIDQFALTKARSSWAEFTREPGGTIYLHMAHMLRGPQSTNTVHQITRSPLHRFTRSPLHQITPSPVHQITPSPVHQITPSPVHQITPSPVHQITPLRSETSSQRLGVNPEKRCMVLCETVRLKTH
ncbi:hypothetical protein NHX12_028009 [Muraenolepis orangiensis]|uniref:Reverse transcriptase domain-containing protein n=2 Tax=Muraenolepis orangiensis TaxID=630683 RepID=A0A9Q0IQZ8_9TELE|nr:hypothetical protein NHX12_028009 [Muraenolepis orangiensis]